MALIYWSSVCCRHTSHFSYKTGATSFVNVTCCAAAPFTIMNTSNTDGMPKSQRFQMDLISNLLEKIPGIARLNSLDRRRFSRANLANRPRNLETVIAFWRFREKTTADRASVLTTARYESWKSPGERDLSGNSFPLHCAWRCKKPNHSW